jgi:hypothetical protein
MADIGDGVLAVADRARDEATRHNEA